MKDRPLVDKDGKGIQFAGEVAVDFCRIVDGQPNVYLLQTTIPLERESQLLPQPGQFYMIRSAKSSVQFNRPISVYSAQEIRKEKNRQVCIQFLILQKGEGTRELCHLLPGEKMNLLGPVGNAFSSVADLKDKENKICIVGGGIGVAPVAFFASSLKPESYDFYASFKSGSYGLENIRARNLVVTTDDGSVGIKGMLPAALNAQTVKEKGYSCIYACGPTPMLSYVQGLAKECGIKAYLSVEHRMLCGVGACLGCTIKTRAGVLRVCKDGPVFDSDILLFQSPLPRSVPLAQNDQPDLGVTICGVHFKNPVFAASGTFGYGESYRGFADVAEWGALCSKGTTLESRDGNAGERIIEIASGNINSIGLQNPGLDEVIKNELPDMMSLEPVAILNLAGSDIASYAEGARLLDATDVPMIELNISCPNVKTGGHAWGMNPDAAFECVSAVRAATKKPLMVKLSPNAPDLRAVALACIKAGADALSLVNTFSATAIDIETGRPFFNNIRAGMCGPAIKPLALRMVYDVVEEINKLPEEDRVPVVGIGGITTWQDAVEFIMAGAVAVEVGTGVFTNPHVARDITEGLSAFMKRKGYKTVYDFCGLAQR